MQRSRFNVKIIFIKYCQIPRPKFDPKLKMLRIYWNLASILYFKYVNFDFKVKNKFYKIFTPKLAPKLKMLRVYWNLAYLILQICWFQFKCQKKMKYLPPVTPKLISKLKMLWKLKFGIFDISNIAMSILMSKIIFIFSNISIKFQFLKNFNKFLAFFILGLICASQFVNIWQKVIFDIKIEIRIFKIWNVPNSNKSEVFSISGPIWV